MTQQQTLAARAAPFGITWDDDKRQWTGKIAAVDPKGNDAPLRFWLTSKQLVTYLDNKAKAGTREVAA